MCQDALNDLKTAIRAAGEHKQRITISIAIDGLRLRDEKTGDCMYHHPVHKISFIAQDMSDSRAFGYIFGSPDTGHRFFGIKTDKTASQVVISMRDLFQVVFELKKKEIEMAKHHIEQHQIKYGAGGSFSDTIHAVKEESESEKSSSKIKYTQPLKTSSITSVASEASAPAPKTNASEAIADLLDLEHELNSIQQGISQMERITPSDPFGPLAKGDPFFDPLEEKPETSKTKNRTASASSCKEEVEKPTTLFGSASSTASKGNFFSQFSPSISKSKGEESHWFDQETESLFDDAVTTNTAEPTSSPVTYHTPTADPDPVLEERTSPKKADVFTDLDPLGTGKVKPYVDKKDFFQELKNPPKKVLKELLGETTSNENNHYFPASFESNETSANGTANTPKESSGVKTSLASASSNLLNSFPSKESNTSSKYSRIDPFDDSDPFEKTDPFLEESFPQSIGFPPLFSAKASFDTVFQEKTPRYEKVSSRERRSEETKMSPLFSAGMSSLHGPLRVSLPPEKADTSTPLSISTITSRFRSSPSPPEDPKPNRRKYYQTLKHYNDDKADDIQLSPQLDDFFYRKALGSPKPLSDRKSPYREKSHSVRSPPPSRYEKAGSRKSSSPELLDYTPDLPPRIRPAPFSIKPPPLPPKRAFYHRPPARPPSTEEYPTHYDFIRGQEASRGRFELDPPKSPRMRRETSGGKESPKNKELRKQNSDISSSSVFPLLPPPPQRKSPAEPGKVTPESKQTPDSKTSSPKGKKESVLNITLNQLDHSGLQNLAVTLGIPSENIYNMTLQELTKRLAQKYLGPSVDQLGEKEDGEAFHADFDSNFSETAGSKKDSPPPFDKYAVFKELIENESKKTDEHDVKQPSPVAESLERIPDTSESPGMVGGAKGEGERQEEDKYAALRQLSLCAQKSENLSEEQDFSIEEDSSARADNISDIVQAPTEESFTPGPSQYTGNESPVTKANLDWQSQPLVSEEVTQEKAEELEPIAKQDTIEEESWSQPKMESALPEEFLKESETKTEVPVVENWATFEKPLFEEEAAPVVKPPAANDNENSPLSSDGKEDIKEIPFDWHRDPAGRRRRRNDVPWQDEDESWDDNSPKESYWSDESSHDDNSPDKRDDDRYGRRSWNKHTRMSKAPPAKDEQWGYRDKWHEDTEDEYEESWRKHRYRGPPCDDERKNSKWDGYECYDKGWSNARGDSWDEQARYQRGGYTERRKRSESDDEYRRRCDSDASDREYVWSFKRGYGEGVGWGDKPKYYASPMYQSARCPDHCHESRSKHKKGSGHKRPSSASDAKRNYGKMYSPVDHAPRSFEKPSSGKRDGADEEFTRYPSYKLHYSLDSSSNHYNSYDRRSQGAHPKKTGRAKRQDSTGSLHKPSEIFSPAEPEKPFPFYSPDKPEETPKLPAEKKPQHFQFEDDFIPSSGERLQHKMNPLSKREMTKSPKKKALERDDWASSDRSEERGFPPDNNNENFANFNDEFEASPKRGKEGRGRGEGAGLSKPHMKAKNHFSILSRQDSSASLRKSESINIFSRENDPFEDDDFFSSGAANNGKLSRFSSEKSKSNSNVSDPFTWKEVFGDANFHD